MISRVIIIKNRAQLPYSPLGALSERSDPKEIKAAHRRMVKMAWGTA